MSEFKPILNDAENLRAFWDGPTNMFARYYTYWQRSLTLMNEGKYVIAILGLGVWKSTLVIPTWVLIAGTIIGLPIMIAIGRWHLFRVQKATEFINAQHGSITGYQGFNMQVRSIQQNDEIIDLLKKLNAKS